MRLLEMITPRAVEGLKVMNDLTTFNGASITFTLPKELKNASTEIAFDIRMRTNDSINWKRILSPRIQVEAGWGFFQFGNLEYANTVYRVKLRIKSKISTDTEEFWSPFKEVEFKTSPTIPTKVPQVCTNCFNVMDNGNVVVYWTAIDELHQSADNFMYTIRGYNEFNDNVLSETSHEAFIVISRELRAKILTLKIFSTNEEGISSSFSEVVIPLSAVANKKKMLKIRKEFDGKFYRISWSSSSSSEVENYTILWCNQRNELPNQCDGPINFLQTMSNSHNFEASEATQFAVAPNFKNTSSKYGFEWAECTAAKPEGSY